MFRIYLIRRLKAFLNFCPSDEKVEYSFIATARS
jgi:hypothetical protein